MAQPYRPRRCDWGRAQLPMHEFGSSFRASIRHIPTTERGAAKRPECDFLRGCRAGGQAFGPHPSRRAHLPQSDLIPADLGFYTEAVQLAKKLDPVFCRHRLRRDLLHNNPRRSEVPVSIDITVESPRCQTYACRLAHGLCGRTSLTLAARVILISTRASRGPGPPLPLSTGRGAVEAIPQDLPARAIAWSKLLPCGWQTPRRKLQVAGRRSRVFREIGSVEFAAAHRKPDGGFSRTGLRRVRDGYVRIALVDNEPASASRRATP